MSKGTLNHLILIGNLGADPEIRQTHDGGVVASLNLATTDRRKNQAGEWVDHTEWHRVTVFGRTAETARDYLKKGSKVLLEGHMRTRKWTDKSGQDRYDYGMFVEDMQLLGGPVGVVSGGSGREPARGAGSSAPRSGGAAAPGRQEEPFDDDIPF
jgi:single-strand DNA-binding protein